LELSMSLSVNQNKEMNHDMEEYSSLLYVVY